MIDACVEDRAEDPVAIADEARGRRGVGLCLDRLGQREDRQADADHAQGEPDAADDEPNDDTSTARPAATRGWGTPRSGS